MEQLIRDHGYLCVFIFACVEGEIAIVTAGILSRHGLMSLPMVVFFAFLGTLMTEQCLFFIGRIYGTRIFEKFPHWQKKCEKVMEFLRMYDTLFIFGSRFAYGIRNITPIVIGMAKITPKKFSSLNVPAAMLWSIIVAGVGYMFADMLESAEGGLKYIKIAALIFVYFVASYLIYKKTKSV
ncbi:MAG: DedA family protein [Holosporaceae bacterium]|jgi:membrane protein DedA with SNARE-associated domain|nr:DedA family protein [Holosporaceae bacterium]